MSIKSSSLVLLVLLCCSLHACSARSLRVLHKESTSAKESNSKQKNMISNPARVSLPSEMKSSSPIITSKRISDKFSPQPENKIQSEPDKGNKVKSNSSTKKNKRNHRRMLSQQATVSWRVPHKKRGEKDAGFNLDYLPPRTHPPAHN